MLTVDGYQVLEILHDGFNSQVYRAYRQTDEQQVVLKLLRKQYPSPEEILRFRLEYDLTQHLQIPEVIQVYGLEPHHNTFFLVLEDYGGRSLQELQSSTSFSVEQVLQIGIQVAMALGEIHRNGIIHKDINPANILLNPETGQVKVIDFGIASQLSRENTQPGNLESLQGTPAYISPEQTGRMNRALDYRTDFYSLGATLYELLSGHPLFTSDDLVELIHSHIARQPIPLHEVNPEIPLPLSQLVMRLIAKDAESRYQSAWGLQLDLQHCLDCWQATATIPPFQLGQQDVSERFQIPQKLYGRDAEVQALLAAFDRVSGQDPASQTHAELVLVSGYSGIGKSALVQEIHKPITAKRGYYISGKYDQFQRNLPYSALIQAFTTLVRQLLTSSEAVIAHWRKQLLAALSPNAAVLIDVIPEIELVIGAQPAVPPLAASAAQARFNLVFENFIRVFSQPQHPLVIFLDDLQWADGASLQLIQVLMTASSHQSLLLLGAYRDNEVDATHPLITTLSDLKAAKVPFQELHLGPLNHADVQTLLRETLPNVAEPPIAELATLLKVKTNGNPFFIGEFLKSLYSEGWITFDLQQGWQWDLSQIEAAQMTDNVVELMAGKLQKLSSATQTALRIGACIGSLFGISLLATVQNQSIATMAQVLWEAAQLGLIVPQDDNYKLLQSADASQASTELPAVEVVYRFLHDRVQQAAYSLIPEAAKAALHLQVGQAMQQQLTAEAQQEYLFDIVNQLNFGLVLMPTSEERQALAALNLRAGRRAIAAAAYAPAYTYLVTGIQGLEADGWDTQYELTLALHQAAAEAAFLKGDFDAMDHLITTVVSQAQDMLDCVPIYTVQIQSFMARHELLAASQQGLKVLRQLKLPLPPTPGQPQIVWGLLRTKVALLGKSTATLAVQPAMTDPRALAATRVLASIASATYLAAPTLFPLTVFKQVELSVRYGNTALSAFSYATYGLILCGVVNDLKGGYSFGQLALQVLERFESQSLRAKTLFVVNAFVRHWRDPLPDTIPDFQQGFQAGYETGDTEYAAFCGQLSIMHGYFGGEALPALEQRAHTMSESILKFKKQPIYELIQNYRQAIANLRGENSNPCRLVGQLYDADTLLPQHIEGNYRTAVFYTYGNYLSLNYWFGNYGAAIAAANQGRQYLDAVVALFAKSWFYFYDALARLALAATVAAPQRRQLLQSAVQTLQKLRTWAASAPSNYCHKVALVEAELDQLRGQPQAAVHGYDRAIASALENACTPEAALANERAALFYLAQQRPKVAAVYFQEARFLYGQWGATAKVNHLESRFPEFFQATPTLAYRSAYSTVGNTVTNITNQGQTSSDLDLVTVMKAAQTLSEEIQLDKLLTTLMRLLIENAGAQRGLLLLETDGRFLIEAQGSVNQADVEVAKALDIEVNPVLSVGIVNYVARTRRSVVLNDASTEGNFVQDAYVQAQQPRSLLCTPLINQGKLAGIVYLENNLTTGAFTPKRLELLNLISTQAAISLENARLYTDLATLNKAYERFVPSQFLQLLGKGSITEVTLGDNVRQEMSILFSDIRDFTTLSEQLSPEENFALINSYLSRMDGVIAEHDGFIDKYIGDAIMALFSGSADDAVQAGVAMLKQLRLYNQQRQTVGYPPLKVGIGINTGSLMLGTVGGQNRMDGTVISDAVNLAARIEGLTKTYNVPLIIGEDTFFNLDGYDQYAFRIIGRTKVKGKLQAVTVYEVFNADEPTLRDGKLKTRARFEEGILLHNNQKFGEACRCFQECLTYNPGDLVAQRYVQQCVSRSQPDRP
ncbi:MAG: AAA family ATPase [Cyanobacteria bacterium J06638_20]